MNIIKEKIIELMNQKDYKPMDIDHLFSYLELTTPDEFNELANTLNELEIDFIVAHNKKGCFGLLKEFHLIKGIVDIKDAGYGFIDTDTDSIFIKSDNLRGALTGDEVLASFDVDSKGRFEGKIERIIKRGTTTLVGKLQFYRNKYVIKSVNYRIDLWVYVKEENLKKAQKGDMVKVEITKFYPNHTADGKILEVIGKSSTPFMDITSLVVNSGINTNFSNETNQMLKSIPSSINIDNYPNRRDLTNKTIITIDGDDARDLDDAVWCEKMTNGNYHLGVYIADVSEYVKVNSPLDKDAYDRGTSVYLVDRVIPMLPKQLSNGICSLNENELRLVMGCEMEINHDGHVINHDIFEGIIKSKHRMTYHNVNEIIESSNQEVMDRYQDIVPMLLEMKDLAKILNEMRKKRGSFNFETSEVKVLLDDKGRAISIVPQTRGLGEKLIEEFMIIANETIATAMTWLDVPFIYRIHEEPKEDKISKFMQILDNFHYKFKVKNKKGMSKALQMVLLDLENREDDIAKTIINNTLLRSMMKARYSETNLGHYGLASECYTHFTSPIRRYPDLLVHRLVKHYMLNDLQIDKTTDNEFFSSNVHYVSEQASKCEKKAENLERDVLDLKKCEYMIPFTNKVFCGIISSVTNWGIYVTLENTVEGLVRFEDMDDYYTVDELNARIEGRRSRKVYQMGDEVRVKLVDIDSEKRQITFKLLGKKE